MRRPLVSLFTVAVLLITACITPASPGNGRGEPDRVVGVLLKCNTAGFRSSGSIGVEYPAEDLSGTDCNTEKSPNRLSITNRRLVITVRTSTGNVFTTEMPPNTSVKVGDPWPPR